MQDYNFFQPYLGKGTRRAEDALPIVPIILIVLFLLTNVPAYNLYRIMRTNRDTKKLEQTVLNSPDYHLLAEISSTRAAIAEATSRLALLDKMDQALVAQEWLNEPFLATLMGVFPRDLTIENLNISPSGQVQMSGAATNKPAIAELELNLRSTGRFASIHVPTITRDSTESVFRFALTMQTKGVSSGAAN